MSRAGPCRVRVRVRSVSGHGAWDFRRSSLTPIVWLYVAFISLLGFLLAIDLFWLNRGSHSISASKALRQTAGWVALALAFNAVIFVLYDNHVFGLGGQAVAPGAEHWGPTLSARPDDAPAPSKLMPWNGRDAMIMYTTGYVLELVLSLDNMMVIAIILTYFKVPSQFQHRVLFWGIIGAVALRGLMIFLGAELVHHFDWVLYVFGAFLLFTAIKLALSGDEESPDLEKNIAVRLTRAVVRVSSEYDGPRFLTRVNGLFAITPLLLALIVVDVADTIFAVDSIPAIFGVTKDPFIVLASNCLAIMGLRAIYFAVAAINQRFRYLTQSMILILGFIGLKMLLPLAAHWPIARDATGGWDFVLSPVTSLACIAAIMGGGILGSVLNPQKQPKD